MNAVQRRLAHIEKTRPTVTKIQVRSWHRPSSSPSLTFLQCLHAIDPPCLHLGFRIVRVDRNTHPGMRWPWRSPSLTSSSPTSPLELRSIGFWGWGQFWKDEDHSLQLPTLCGVRQGCPCWALPSLLPLPSMVPPPNLGLPSVSSLTSSASLCCCLLLEEFLFPASVFIQERILLFQLFYLESLQLCLPFVCVWNAQISSTTESSSLALLWKSLLLAASSPIFPELPS